jgi:hypothetical protein
MFVVTYFLKPSTAATQAARQPGDVGKPSPPTAGSLAAERNLADDLARAVRQVIEPANWKNNGGQGTIESIGGGVVVRQTRRVHHQVLRFWQPFDVSATPAEIGVHGPILSSGVGPPF